MLGVLRHKALESLRRAVGLSVCFEDDPYCEIVVLNGHGPYRLFDTNRVRIRMREGRYVDEYLL